MAQTDTALVEQCLLGQKEAYTVLVRRHQDRVFYFALRMTGDRDDASDLAQETFIRAYHKLHTYNPGYAFRNWLLSICSNLGKNRYRSRERKRKAEEVHLSLNQGNPNNAVPAGSIFDEALKTIPETLRIPLVLKHVEGLSYEEIAQILNLGVSAAKMRVKRGREILIESYQRKQKDAL